MPQNIPVIWVANSPFLDKCQFLRTEVGFLLDHPAAGLVNAFRYSLWISGCKQSKNDPTCGLPDSYQDVRFYHVRKKRSLDELIPLCEQDVANGDVFVLVRRDDTIYDPITMVQQTQQFPEKIADDIPAHITSLTMEELERRRKSPMLNTITVNLGPGAIFNGNVGHANIISDSFNAAKGTPEPTLRDRLEEMVIQVSRLIESLDKEEMKSDVAQSLKTLVDVAKSDQPAKKWYEFSANGILEAAKTVAALTEPVTTSIKAVLALLA